MDDTKVISVNRFYAAATVNRTEKRLRQQAKDSWRLLNKSHLFTFQKWHTGY